MKGKKLIIIFLIINSILLSLFLFVFLYLFITYHVYSYECNKHPGCMNESGIILALSYIFLPFVIYFLINTIFFIVFYYKRYSIYANKKYIGRKVHVVMDRKIGSTHPKHPNIVYPINYGYIPGLLGGDGEEQDVYILGVDKPIDEFDGRIIAVIYRYNDNETKWVAANMYDDYSIDYIKKVTHFQEQYYKIKIIK